MLQLLNVSAIDPKITIANVSLMEKDVYPYTMIYFDKVKKNIF